MYILLLPFLHLRDKTKEEEQFAQLEVGNVGQFGYLQLSLIKTTYGKHIYFEQTIMQTWKKARTRGHCPRKFMQIAEILRPWGLILLKYAVKQLKIMASHIYDANFVLIDPQNTLNTT